MFAALTLTATPYSMDELAKSLEVTPRRHQHQRPAAPLARPHRVRVTRPGDRRDYFQVSGDAATVLSVLGLRRLTAMRAVIHSIGAAARRTRSERSRVRRMEALYDKLLRRLQLELAQ